MFFWNSFAFSMIQCVYKDMYTYVYTYIFKKENSAFSLSI